MRDDPGPTSSTGSRGTAPLAGIVVLDLSDAALVQAGRLLADLGATLIRVESLDGDAIRRRPPFVDGQEGLERGLAHLLYNHGKLSVALNLESSEAWDAIGVLTEAADVVIAPLEKNRHA